MKPVAASLLLAAIGSLAAAGTAPTGQPLWTSLPAEGGPYPAGVEEMGSLAELIERARPAVVAVHTSGQRLQSEEDSGPSPLPLPPWWSLPGMPEPEQVEGIGSGFVLRSDGLILTNQHVVAGAENIWVRLAGSSRHLAARLVGSDERSDLALLRVEPRRPLPVLPLGDSDRLRPGQWVVAIGNPLGLSQVATSGIISGLGRGLDDLVGSRAGFNDFIQTDAAIDQGNSGGPLINLRGEVVGINTAINSRARGIGFAVPIDLAKAVLPHLARHGRLVRSFLGVTVEDLSWEVARSFGLPGIGGVVITAVREDSPAERAGLKRGDVLLGLAGSRLRGRADLAWRAATRPAGKPIRLDVWRDGHQRQLVLVPEERPGERDADRLQKGDPAAMTPAEPPSRLGLKVVDLSEAVAKAAGLGAGIRGAVVVVAQGLASESGLRLGDVITEVNGQPVGSVAELKKRLAAVATGEMIRFYVRRQNGALFVALKKTWKD